MDLLQQGTVPLFSRGSLLVLCSFPLEHLGNKTHIMCSGGHVKDVYY